MKLHDFISELIELAKDFGNASVGYTDGERVSPPTIMVGVKDDGSKTVLIGNIKTEEVAKTLPNYRGPKSESAH